MSKKWIAGAIIAGLLIAPLGVKLVRGDAPKAVETEQVAMQRLRPSILASGTLNFKSQVTLASEIVGRVDEIRAKEGDRVEKGQPLVMLDSIAARADIEQIKTQIRQAELDIERRQVDRDAQVVKWKRYHALRDAGIVNAGQYDDYVTQKDMAEVELRASRERLKEARALLVQAEERLSKTLIRSPLSGQVTQVSIKVGETAVPSAMSIAGSTLLVVADTSAFYAEVNIDETDIARVIVGARAQITPAALPDLALDGVVEEVPISPKQNTGQSKTYPVRVRLQSVEGIAFRPGMSCRAEVFTEKADGALAVSVPLQALKYEDADKKDEGARTSVFVVDRDRAVKRFIDVGISDDTYIEVTQGLKTGEHIVVGPAKILRFLRDGERIAVRTTPR